MGILSRFADIISANINALLDKAENPEKMIDEYLRRAMEDLAEVKQETAAVMAEENRCQRLWEENRKDVEEISRERSDIKVCKVNVDEQPELAGQFGVMSIPTLVVMKNGKIVNQSIGAKPKNAILAML